MGKCQQCGGPGSGSGPVSGQDDAAAKVRVCPKCGEPVVQSGRGRPKLFCSSACRRATEYEVRRAARNAGLMGERVLATQERVERLRRGAVGLGTLDHWERVLDAQEAVLGDAVVRLETLLKAYS